MEAAHFEPVVHDLPFDDSALCIITGARGTGTGFLFLKPTWVVTAKHVTATSSTAPTWVQFGEHEPRPARLVFTHPVVDLAVLELLGEPAGAHPLRPGRSMARELVCVGYRPSLSVPTRGEYRTFVSRVEWYQRSRRQRDGHAEHLFIFPAPHGEPGHSGGPVLTPAGEVVAVVTDGITLGGQHLIRATSIAPLRRFSPPSRADA